MSLFKSIRVKIMAPPFLLFLIVVIIALVIGNAFFKNALNTRVNSKLISEQERLLGNIQFQMEEISKTVILFSSIEVVKENLMACRITGNSDTCKILFDKNLKGLSDKFDSDLNFYLPNGELIYSNHKGLLLDEDDSYTFDKVVKSKELINFIGNFSGKLRIVSLSPVIVGSDVVGIVTVSLPFNLLAAQFYLPAGEEFLLTDNFNNNLYQSSFGGQHFDKIKNNFDETSTEIFSFNNYKVIPIDINNQNNAKIAKAYIFSDVSGELSFLVKLLYYIILFGIGAFVIIGFFYIYFMNKIIVNPINVLYNTILQIAKGEQAKELQINREDEIGEMMKAVNVLITNQKNIANFASHIGKGVFDEEFNPLSNEDRLGNALLEMRNNLLHSKELEEKRKKEDEQRRWSAEGLAKFGEILRQNNNDIQKLSDEIIRNLVHYVDAIQGGLFILNDNNKENVILELSSVYAYDRKKFMEKEIKLGEGLVGTCAIEKLPIYLTDVPNDYVNITSGLGDANPRSILLMPMKIEDNVFGVIELASFKEFEPYKQEFIEKLSENIASTLNAVKINIRTSQLLEQSQQQAEELSAQEEEMRQNMEELMATQEEARHRESELNNIIAAIDGSFVRMELNKNREILLSNKKTTDILEYSISEIKGKDFMSLIESEQYADFEKLWEHVINGKYQGGIYKIVDKKGEYIDSYLVFNPVLNDSGEVEKIIMIQNILI